MGVLKGKKTDLKIKKIPLSMSKKMYILVEKRAEKLEISQQGFIRMAIIYYIDHGPKAPYELENKG